MKSQKPLGSRVRGAAIGVACSVAIVAGMCPAVALADTAGQAVVPEDATSALATESPFSVELSIPEGAGSSVCPGKEFSLDFKASAASGAIACAQVDFSFDAAKVQVKEIKLKDGVKGESSSDNVAGTGRLTFMGNATSSITPFTIVFTVDAKASGDTEVKITSAVAGAVADFSGSEADFSSEGVTVKIEEAKTGAEAFVDRLYQNVLGRKADDAGRAAQVAGMQAMGAAQIVYNFYNGEEFANRSATMTNAEIVKNVYKTMLDRDADPAGLAMWTEYLDNGMSVCAVVAGFVESQEFGNLCANYGLPTGSAKQLRAMLEPRDRNPGITAFASRMYTKVLGRSAEIAGLNGQCQALLNGMPAWQIAVNFFTSEEFMNKHLSGMNIVRTAYQAILGRDAASTEADTEGRMYWHERIHGDSYDVASITDVVKGMCQSDEFENICKSCGMTSGMR